jgi:hypothetical protein
LQSLPDGHYTEVTDESSPIAFGGLTMHVELRKSVASISRHVTFAKATCVGDGTMLADRSRRRWERHDITIPVEVTTVVNGDRSVFSGRATDISRGGLRLFLTRELEPGTSVKMEFLLPYHSMQLVIRGVVRNREGYTHGVEFSNPTSFQQQIIERTCNVFGLLR